MTGAELKKQREKMGLRQSELAEALSNKEQRVDVGTISRWERDVSKIPPYLELALAELRRRLR
jgi:transcriptional regulator with XRE-family HTH domain